MSDKDYAGMETCWVCGNDTGALLLDKRLRKTLPRHAVTGSLCPNCQGVIDQGGLLVLISEKEGAPHHSMIGLTSEGADKLMEVLTFTDEEKARIRKGGIVGIEQGAAEQLGLMDALKAHEKGKKG